VDKSSNSLSDGILVEFADAVTAAKAVGEVRRRLAAILKTGSVSSQSGLGPDRRFPGLYKLPAVRD
jgi:hypothetical protein